jgi:ketosteroid isomerase-like protein
MSRVEGNEADEAKAIEEVANRLFTAIEDGDRATVDQLWDDNIAVWRVGASRDNDKVRALRVIDWFIGVTGQRRYQILDRVLFDDEPARGFVQQHILHATGHAGESISLRVCIVIKIGTNGLISRIDEYFDPAGIAVLLNSGDDAGRIPMQR